MRTTLNIDDYLFQNLLRVTKAKTKTEAVRIALKEYLHIKQEYLHIKRKEKVLAMRGKLDISENWQELRQREVKESEAGSRA